MRKKDDNLRDTLLDFAREITKTQGIDSVNIRSLAGMAGVATGTVYNYFSSKDEILLALTEEYWQQTLLEMKQIMTGGSFLRQLEEIYEFLKSRINQQAGKLMSSLGNVETAGHARMQSMQSILEADLIRCMEMDPDVGKDIWDEAFTREELARFIMRNLMLQLKSEAPDIHFLISIIRRAIY